MKILETISYFAITLAMVSCAAGEPCQKCLEADEAQTLKRVSVSITGVNLTTKAVSNPEDERRINTCQLYVFSTEGKLFNRLVSDSTDFEFFIGNGLYNVYAFVNAPELPLNPESEYAFLGSTIKLSDNNCGNIVMTGSLKGVCITESSDLEIEVSRMVSKVNCSVKVDIGSEMFREMDFEVLSVFMTNVVGEETIFSEDFVPADSMWFNKRNYCPSENDNLLYDEVNEIVPGGDSLRTKSTFYILPNRCEDPEDRDGWSPRRTRFVVKARLGSFVYYYPVTIPRVISNREYYITLDIKSIGYLDPEDTEETLQAATCAVTIQSWSDGGVIDYSR